MPRASLLLLPKPSCPLGLLLQEHADSCCIVSAQAGRLPIGAHHHHKRTLMIPRGQTPRSLLLMQLRLASACSSLHYLCASLRQRLSSCGTGPASLSHLAVQAPNGPPPVCLTFDL